MDTTMDPPKWSKGIKMRLRAEGRQKVQSKVTAGLFRYLISGPGIVKVIRLMLNLGAVVSFIMAPAQESYIAILLLECCIVLSFIIIYVLGLHHLLVCILWPAFDIVNCLLTSGFLIVIGILVLWEEGIDVLIVSGAACCFTASVLCFVDVACQGGKMWFKKWKAALKEKLIEAKEKQKETET